MIEEQVKRQQRHYFLNTLIAFGVIFLVLGVIVFQLVQTSIYRSTDQELSRVATDQNFLLAEANHTTPPAGERGPRPNQFQQQILLWKDGQIINQNDLGSRIDDFSHINLSTQDLDKVTTLQVKDRNQQTLQFRSITVKSPTATADYIQILINTDPIVATIQSFQRILIICMVIFAILSVFLSYYLSKRFMRPLLTSMRQQQQFIENASHELRTPLTIIQAKLEKLFTRPDHTILEESEDVALALNEVSRLSQLTNDLLTLARSDNPQWQLHKQPVQLAALLTKIVTPYQELAEAEEKQLLMAADDFQVSVDPERLQELLVILIDNALKFTQAGEKITVTAKKEHHHWQLVVADTGKGISAEERERIFERFYREDAARGRGGYGIGLSIAERIITAHKGTVQVVDNQPKGTRFVMQFPLKS